MESYSDFLYRISYQQPELQIGEGRFTADNRVLEKVSHDNSFSSFYGDTVVFDLKDKAKKKISAQIDTLYEEVPMCFAQRLDSSTLHMTLHDLSASSDLDSVSSNVFNNEVKLLRVLSENHIACETIDMRMNYIVNMVNTSLVLALVPENENEWNKLQKLYTLIDEVRVCPYPYLTPHITLAYFNRSGFDMESAAALKTVVRELNSKSIKIHLHTDHLVYQKFLSMDNYIDVFRLAKKL